MVQRTILVLEDDVDGGDATQTVKFSIDGSSYEIDLNDKNAAKLRDAMALWVGHARKAGRASAAAPSSRRRGGRTSEVRAWAQAQGLTVSERGRVSKEVMDAYDAAH